MKKTNSKVAYTVSYKTRIKGKNAKVKYTVSFDGTKDDKQIKS